MLKTVFSIVSIFYLFVSNSFALPLDDIRKQFIIDSIEFKYDPAFVEGEEKKIIESYNKETGSNATNIQAVPRSYSCPLLLALHDTKKMLCRTQCIYYDDLFKKSGIRSYVVHITQYHKNSNRNGITLDCMHDDLIYYDDLVKYWKVIDFSGAVETMSVVRSRLSMFGLGNSTQELLSCTWSMGKLTGSYFDKSFKDLLSESRNHWLAVTYYDEDTQKDLGELDSELNDCLGQLQYMRAEVNGREVRLFPRA